MRFARYDSTADLERWAPEVLEGYHRRLRRAGKAAFAILLLTLVLIAMGKVMMPEEIATMMAEAEAFEEEHPEAFQSQGGVHAARVGPAKPEATYFLIHGSPGDWQAFVHYLKDEELTERYQLIAPDRPGYGQTAKGQPLRSFREQAEALVPWAESVQSGERIWVGHSFGVPIIAKLAVIRPDLVDGMVFVAGAMDAELEPRKWYHKAGNTWLARLLLPSDWDVANQESIAFEQELAAMEPEWSQIDCPVTIIHARDDSLADYRHVDFTMERMRNPKPKLVELDSGDHFIPWNRYDRVKEEMVALASRAAK